MIRARGQVETVLALTGIATAGPAAGQWIVRVVLSLLFWPVPDPATERALVERFVEPNFAA
ncbi:hypothetical protein ACFWF7_35485 [Nocardia sp. NPDC060256]|uniref:hypothetical protein n=1 Tax=unclassified Nocardia TaxID=2637762 RepID=UPI0036565E4B